MNKLARSETSDDSLDAVDAAAVMLSLRNGPKYRQRKSNMWQVITTSPSQDHTYSAAENLGDEAFESEDERYLFYFLSLCILVCVYEKKNEREIIFSRVLRSATCRKISFDDEEERKIKEGAETLLNLAGITTRKHGIVQAHEWGPVKRPKEIAPQPYERPSHFRPRLLRKKDKLLNNNNIVKADDAWARYRRELENGQAR